jgi:hypothetical protein
MFKPYPKKTVKDNFKEKTLWAVFSVYIRLRDSDENGYCKCITCGVVRKWNDHFQCGHGIPRQHWGTRYDEKNNHSQCAKCNGPEGGEQAKYKEAVNKKYGPETWDLLLYKKQHSKKPSALELRTMYEYYKNEVTRLKKIKGISL